MRAFAPPGPRSRAIEVMSATARLTTNLIMEPLSTISNDIGIGETTVGNPLESFQNSNSRQTGNDGDVLTRAGHSLALLDHFWGPSVIRTNVKECLMNRLKWAPFETASHNSA